MQATNKFRGPWPPTCIGSVLASPQLLDPQHSPSVGPLLFDRHGDPEKLFSANWQELEQSEVGLSLSPSHLLQDNLDSDTFREIINISKTGGYFGNKLHGFKCVDGTTQLFFPVGDNQDRVGSALVSSPRKRHLRRSVGDHGNVTGQAHDKYVVSPSLGQPILQLTAIQDDVEAVSNVSRSLIALRSLYHINVLSCHRQGDKSCFNCAAQLDFKQRVSHVAWNPHIYGEAAAVFERGDVHLFDTSTSSGKLHLRPLGSIHPVTDNVGKTSDITTERPFWMEQTSRREKIKTLQKGLNSYNKSRWSDVDAADFWCCEYAWHPRTLFRAGSQEVSLFDFRNSSGLSSGSSSCERVIQSRCLNVAQATRHGYCTQSVGEKDHFLAFSRDNSGGMYHFCVASRKHVLLYDVRRPQRPVLQWEHAMAEEPPRLLLISSFAQRAPSRLHLPSIPGKVIFAASVQSGDIRAFCYGPQSVAQIPAGDMRPPRRKCDIDDVLCAWQLPSKVFAPLQTPDDSSEILPSTKDLSPESGTQTSSEEGQVCSRLCISGLLVMGGQGNPVSSQMRSADFAMMQLSGDGDIIAQKYRFADRLTSGSSNPVPKSSAPVPGNRLQCKAERMPATLNYIREGQVWPAYRLVDEDDRTKKLNTGKKRRSFLDASVRPGKHIKSRQPCDVDLSEMKRCHWEMVNSGDCKWEALGDNKDSGAGDGVGESDRILRHLCSPLGMYLFAHGKAGMDWLVTCCDRLVSLPINHQHEVGRKGVQLGLSSGVAQVASGMPYGSEDVMEQKTRIPSHIPVLYGEAKVCTRADVSGEETFLLPGDGEGKAPEETFRVPLPLLLELQQQVKSSSIRGYLSSVMQGRSQQPMAAAAARDKNTARDGGDTTWSDLGNGGEGGEAGGGLENGGETVGTHNMLVEKFCRVGQDLERWCQEGPFVSLADSSQSKSQTCGAPTAILSYKVAQRPLPNDVQAHASLDDEGRSEPGSLSSGPAADAAQRLDYSRFVAARVDEGQDGPMFDTGSVGLDQSLCPVKLPYEDKDFGLDSYKLEKLRSVEMSFGKWQQAFSPYKSFVSNAGE